MSNPVSAMIESPFSSNVNKLLASVTCLSLLRSAYKSETNYTEPAGLMPIRPFAVL